MDCPTLVDRAPQDVIIDDNANTSDVDTKGSLKVGENKTTSAQNVGAGEPPPDPTELKEVLLTSFSRLSRNSTYSDSAANQTSSFDGYSVPPLLSPKRPPRGFNLKKFITAGIAIQLKSLGVDELDCKEYIDAWLSHRRQRRWSQTAYKSASIFPSKGKTASNTGLQHAFQVGLSGTLNEESSEQRITDFFGRSEPNSSLLRLSGEGNVELGQFLTRMEEVRGYINNATCNLLQSVSLLMLPYLKLLNANELETTDLEKFIKGSIGTVLMMASELSRGPQKDKETKQMVERELRKLQSEVKELHEGYSRLFKKFGKVFRENKEGCEKAVFKIHPRGLTPLKKGRVEKNKPEEGTEQQQQAPTEIQDGDSFLKESCRFSQVPVYQATFTPADIFKNHILFGKSKAGNLLYKTDIEGNWNLFVDLPISKQKELFLTVLEDLHWCLKNSISSVHKVKELVKQGYPENISSKIRENLAYLKTLAKRPEEVLVLSKVTIVNQINSLREAAGRVIRILEHVSTLSKSYLKSVQSAKKEISGSFFGPTRKPLRISNAALNTDRMSLMYTNSYKVKLLIPFPTSADPMEDQFSMSLV